MSPTLRADEFRRSGAIASKKRAIGENGGLRVIRAVHRHGLA